MNSQPRRIIGLAEKYRAHAVLVPVVARGGKDHFLLERRAAEIPQGGEICFPGGRIDPGDADSLAAALRETREELGVDAGLVGPAHYLGTVLAPMGAAVDAWLARLSPSLLCRPNPAEVAETLEIPCSWFAERQPERQAVRLTVHPHELDPKGGVRVHLPAADWGLPDRYRRSWPGGLYPVWNYPSAHGPIWGLSAEIIAAAVDWLKENPL